MKRYDRMNEFQQIRNKLTGTVIMSSHSVLNVLVVCTNMDFDAASANINSRKQKHNTFKRLLNDTSYIKPTASKVSQHQRSIIITL